MKTTEFLEQAEIDAIFAMERLGSGRFEKPSKPAVEPLVEPVEEVSDGDPES